MSFTDNDFIEVYDDKFDNDALDTMIVIFEKLCEEGWVLSSREDQNKEPHIKDDTSYQLARVAVQTMDWSILSNETFRGFREVFWNCFEEYRNRYSILKDFAFRFTDIKIRRTEVGQGYHVWHYERLTHEARNKVFDFMLYLNDVEEGGETEFLYLKKRFKPKKNRLLIFPTEFMYTHRGNPPLSNTKYVIGGWLEYIN